MHPFPHRSLSNRQQRRFMLLPQDHTVLVRQTSKWGQIFLMSLVGLGATAFATAWFYKLDEVITVKGRLVPKQGGVEVRSPVAGQLEELLIENGKYVKKGENIIIFDVKSALAEKVILESEIGNEKTRIFEQLESNRKRQYTVKRNIELAIEILDRLKPLERSGAISELQILQQKNRLEALKDELTQLEGTKNQITNDSKTRENELRRRLNVVEKTLKYNVIKAPISGTIFDLKPDNDNYITTNAESLLKIVPIGELSGKVKITNQDIGFIRKGQEVKVRVDAFPYTEYGEIDGTIKSIGADALPPSRLVGQYHFPVDLSLSRSTLETRSGMVISLRPGMTITTNLKLRDRRLIELLSDLFTNRGESLKRLRQP